MATAVIISVVVSFAFFVHQCGAIDMARDKASMLVRRESTLETGAIGEDASGEDKPRKAKNTPDMCKDAFIYGLIGNSRCQDAGANTTNITDVAMCELAATMMNFGLPNAAVDGPVIIDRHEFAQYPSGCFHKPCSTNPTSGCLYFNGQGDYSWSNVTDPAAFPVCHVPRYMAMAGGCTGDYEAVNNTNDCASAATCSGTLLYGHKNVWDKNYTRGCIKDTDPQDGLDYAHFNHLNTSEACQSNCAGQEICKHKVITALTVPMPTAAPGTSEESSAEE